MVLIGELASGAVHDLNNMLGAIESYAELSKDIVDRNSEVTEFLDEMTNSSQRARDLLARILSFSREQFGEFTDCNLAEVIDQTLTLLRGCIPKNITIDRPTAGGSFFVRADPLQLYQVLMNLCINASQAIDGNGTIRFTLKTKQQNEKALCELCVSDDGPGIPENIRSRIFEHSFTTKKDSGGSGIGLALVKRIIEAHKGTIRAESQEGCGTTFILQLPLSQQTL